MRTMGSGMEGIMWMKGKETNVHERETGKNRGMEGEDERKRSGLFV